MYGQQVFDEVHKELSQGRVSLCSRHLSTQVYSKAIPLFSL